MSRHHNASREIAKRSVTSLSTKVFAQEQRLDTVMNDSCSIFGVGTIVSRTRIPLALETSSLLVAGPHNKKGPYILPRPPLLFCKPSPRHVRNRWSDSRSKGPATDGAREPSFRRTSSSLRVLLCVLFLPSSSPCAYLQFLLRVGIEPAAYSASPSLGLGVLASSSSSFARRITEFFRALRFMVAHQAVLASQSIRVCGPTSDPR
jgi:hypothetical protein